MTEIKFIKRTTRLGEVCAEFTMALGTITSSFFQNEAQLREGIGHLRDTNYSPEKLSEFEAALKSIES